MQINLLPKSKEEQKRRKKIQFLVTFICVAILSITVSLVIVSGGINLIRKNTILDLKKDIDKTKDNITVYVDLEKDVLSLMSRLDAIEQIFKERKKWEVFLEEVQSFMPRETFLSEMELPDNKVTFKIVSPTIDKVAEFIESMRDYKIEVDEGNVSENEAVHETKKINLFEELEISAYSKETKESVTVYLFEVKAKFSEDLWKKK